jgi:hypothetical protein
MRPFTVRLPCVVLLTCLVGCGSGNTLRVDSIQLGRSLNADNTVAGHTTTFKPGETVYVSVLTTGSGSGTLSVRWMYARRVLGEPTKQVSYRDVAATEFRLESATGFPVGEYTVEVFLDGESVGTRAFRVEAQR